MSNSFDEYTYQYEKLCNSFSNLSQPTSSDKYFDKYFYQYEKLYDICVNMSISNGYDINTIKTETLKGNPNLIRMPQNDYVHIPALFIFLTEEQKNFIQEQWDIILIEYFNSKT